jgi:hypothetical protein
VDTGRHRLHLGIQARVQHTSPTFEPGLLATAVGTSSWRESPTVGSASLDNTDAAAAVTFFFATDGKTYSCLSIRHPGIQANIKRLANSSIYVYKRPSLSAGHNFTDAILNVGGSDEGGNGNDTEL